MSNNERRARDLIARALALVAAGPTDEAHRLWEHDARNLLNDLAIIEAVEAKQREAK